MNDTSFIQQQLHLLLTGYGYNLYNTANRARADDLLVREKACGALGDAANQLSRLATEYALLYIPPSTREQPFPPAGKMAQLRQIEALRDEVSLLASRIRGMSVPTQDRVWARFRDEVETLHRLLSYDYQLIVEADAVYKEVEALTVEAWSGEDAVAVRSQLHALEKLAHDRERLLTVPFQGGRSS